MFNLKLYNTLSFQRNAIPTFYSPHFFSFSYVCLCWEYAYSNVQFAPCIYNVDKWKIVLELSIYYTHSVRMNNNNKTRKKESKIQIHCVFIEYVTHIEYIPFSVLINARAFSSKWGWTTKWTVKTTKIYYANEKKAA